jgi:hypothetical protein
LIILDASRYDIFSDVNTIEGEMTPVTSSASHSEEFVKKNFNGRTLHDTVYISANPFIEKIEERTFHKIIKSYGKEYPKGDPIYESRHPGKVCNIARDAYEVYDDKRIIVHFMQPHTPYLGSKAEDVRTELKNDGIKFRNWKNTLTHGDNWVSELLDAGKKGYISHDKLVELYTENLMFVLDYAESILDEFEGKSVITSDHGEMLGDPSGLFLPARYVHKRNYYCPELRRVPWLVVDSGTRRTITADEPEKTEDVEETEIDEQLTALGYL